MKTFKMNLGREDAILQAPDNVEINYEEAMNTLAINMQDQIVAGNINVTVRMWPCLLCDKDLKAQGKLHAHLKKKHNFDHLKQALNTMLAKKGSP